MNDEAAENTQQTREEETVQAQSEKKEDKGKDKEKEHKEEEEHDTSPAHSSAAYYNDEQEAIAVRCLSEGFLEHLNAPLLRLAKQLHELEESQCALINSLTAQNEKLETLPQWSHIVEVVSKAPTYNQKLHQMRDDMNNISDRMKKLKVRTTKLTQRKMQMEEKERQLTAQPSASLLQRGNSNKGRV